MRAFLRDNGLWLCFAGLFALSVVGQAFAGLADHNHLQVAAGVAESTWGEYVTSSDFATDVAENWQSEYLQFFLYIIVTVWLVQRGSPESKKLDEAGTESAEDQQIGRYATDDSPRPARRARGAVLWFYANSLGTVMALIFAGSWAAQSISGLAAYNDQLLLQLEDPITWWGYVTSADFWNRTLQNWQSEFLAIASMAALSIYLRQRGSPESKPVGTPHEATGIES
ncbi:DUF6766 family protein [Pseudonocardia sp. CA-107938]|uniref:DUF6766 family protein n=1 Tax=Pseudonocardia sp. CA-107938 TaxID=3240021 RepID=UPI003D94E9B2